MKKDHTFVLSITGEPKLAIAFCDSSKADKLAARVEVEKVLGAREIPSYQLAYLGLLDYGEMDPEIVDHLHYFEKYEKVWLLR
jgi:hypothetical protein